MRVHVYLTCLLLSLPLAAQQTITPPSPPQATSPALTEAQHSPALAATNAQPAAAALTVISEGTPISLKLDETVSSASAKVGQHVAFLVIEDVKVNGATIVPIGSNAIGTVTDAEPKKWAGRAGKLDINIDSVRLPTGQKVLLSATPGGKGGGHGAAVTAGVIGTSLIFFPAAPFLLMIHGKDMVLPQGTPVKAFVSGDTTISPTAVN